MTSSILKIPVHFELQPALDFAHNILALPDDVAVLGIDFQPWATVQAYELPLKPFGMLLVSSAVQEFKSRDAGRVVTGINLPGNEIEGYAAHMGFFDACGIPVDKPFGNARGNQRYQPITISSVNDFLLSDGSPDYGQVKELSLTLARVLTQQQIGGSVDALEFAFREILRNVLEHSQSPDLCYSAQFWPSLELVEIGIIDQGVGLRSSLCRNHYLLPLINSAEDAIKHAIMPGISGKWNKDIADDPDNPWQNTGFGLYLNYRLCGNGGDFFIASDKIGLYRNFGANKHEYLPYPFTGVGLRLRLKAQTLRDIYPLLARYKEEGETVATKIAGGHIPNTNRMSMMLRDDFDLLEYHLSADEIPEDDE